MSDFIKITSKDNDTVKRITQLQKSSAKRREEGVFVLEGLRLCTDAVKSGHIPEITVVSSSALDKYYSEIVALGAASSFVVPDSLFAKISDTVSPQGILCVCKIPQHNGTDIDRRGKYIALDNLQDPSNLGAIARTAEALGISGIIVQGGCDPYSSKSLRASMGALLRIPLYRTDDMFGIITEYGFTSFATVISGHTHNVGEMMFPDGCVVIIGNEANGISAETGAKADMKITIPMRGKAESLNAAVAASIVMWEMCK